MGAVASGSALIAFVRGVRAHPVLIIATIAAALVGSAVFALRAPTYEATAKILVTPLPVADRSLIVLPLPRVVNEPERAVNTAAGILESPAAATLAARRLGAPATANSVQNAITVEAEAESNIVRVVGESKDPEQAAEIANQYARAALDVRVDELRPLVAEALAIAQAELERLPAGSVGVAELLRTRIVDLSALRGGTDPTLSLAQTAPVPSAPAGTPRALVLGLALIAGIVIGLAAAVLVELLVGRRMDAENELRELYPLPVLGRIPVQDGPPPSREPAPAVADAYRALRVQVGTRRDASGGTQTGATILVTSSGRGEGRTTTAVGLARALAGAGQTVLVLDFDLERASVNDYLMVLPDRDLSDVLMGLAPLADVVVPVDAGLSIVAAARGSHVLADQLSAAGPAILDQARALAAWVIIDAAPLADAPELLSMAAWWDQVLVLTWLGRTDAAALVRTRELLESLEQPASGHVVIGSDRVDWEAAQNGRGALSRALRARPKEPR